MPRSRRKTRSLWWDDIGLYLLLAALTAAPLLFGSVLSRPRYLYLLDGLLLLSFLATLFSRTAAERSVRFPATAWLTSGLLLAGLFSLLPLPAFLTGLLSPAGAQVASDSARVATGSGPSWLPLSLDPPASSLQALNYLALTLAASVTATYIRREKERLIIRLIAVTGLLGAVIGLFQKLANLDTIYGLGLGSDSPAFLLSTFVSPNQQAAFFSLTVPLQIYCLHKASRLEEKLLWAGAAVATITATFLTLSIGGSLALLVVLLLLGVLFVARRRPWSPRFLPLVISSTVAAIAIWLAVFPLLAREFAVAGDALGAKMALWRDTLRIVADYPLTGAGAHTFPTLYNLYRTDISQVVYSYPENFLLMLLVDYGIPVTLAFAGSAALLFFLILTSRPLKSYHICLLAVVLGAALHDLSDFSLSSMGVALPFMVAFTLAMQDRKSLWFSIDQPRRALLVGAAAAGLFFLLFGYAYLGGLQRSRSTLWNVSASAETFSTELARQVARHPTDYHLFEIAAWVFSSEETVQPWQRRYELLERAVQLHPMRAHLHQNMARLLLEEGRFDPALESYRRAARLDGDMPSILAEVYQTWHQTGPLMRVAAAHPDGARQAIRMLQTNGYEQAADEVLGEFIASSSVTAEILYDAAVMFLKSGRQDELERVLQRLQELFPHDPRRDLLRARIAFAGRDLTGADELVTKILDKHPGHFAALTLRAEILIRQGMFDEALGLLKQALAIAWRSNGQRAGVLARMGTLHLQRGFPSQAVPLLRQAVDSEPGNAFLRQALGDALERTGDLRGALSSYRSFLKTFAGDKSAVEAKVRRIESVLKPAGGLPVPAPAGIAPEGADLPFIEP